MDRPLPAWAGRWRTWANALSGLRLLAAPGVALALLAGAAHAALALVTLAIVTDLADGRIARRRAESSPLGGLLDHGADAAFVTCGLAALAARGEMPWLLPPVIALAFAEYALDSRLSRGLPLRGSRLGRWNGIAYFVALGVPVARDVLGLDWPPSSALRAFGWALVGTSVLSVVTRLREARR